MAAQMLLLIVSMWLLAGNFLAEATYYRHHRLVPHHRYREHSANTENLLPEVSNPVPDASQPAIHSYPEIPEVFHPAPEVLHSIPEPLHPVPEVFYPAPEANHLPEVFNAVHEASRPLNMSRVFYGIMFDAGSTGTRIHIYKFIQKDPGECFSLSASFSLSQPQPQSQEPIGLHMLPFPTVSVCCWVIHSVV